MTTKNLTLGQRTIDLLCFGEPRERDPHRALYIMFDYFLGNPRAETALLRDHKQTLLDLATHLNVQHTEAGDHMTRLLEALEADDAAEVIDSLAAYHGAWLAEDARRRMHPQAVWGTKATDGTVRCFHCTHGYLDLCIAAMAKKPDGQTARYALSGFRRLYEVDEMFARGMILDMDPGTYRCDLCGLWSRIPRECSGCGHAIDEESLFDGLHATSDRCPECGDPLSDNRSAT